MTEANNDMADTRPPTFDGSLGMPGQYNLEHTFIAISGLIGAGKSTLAAALGKLLQLPVYYEPVANNEYLEDFYKDMGRYSFAMQVYLLNKRFKQQQQIIWQGVGGVQDRTIYEDSIFAKMLRDSGMMDDRDYRTYCELFNNISNFMSKPNLIVHLDVSPEESYERIKSRARNCEQTIPLEYLKNLHAAYEDFLEEIAKVIPVIRVNWSQFRTVEETASAISREYAKIQNVRYVNFRTLSPAKTRPPRAQEGENAASDKENTPAKTARALVDDGAAPETAL